MSKQYDKAEPPEEQQQTKEHFIAAASNLLNLILEFANGI